MKYILKKTCFLSLYPIYLLLYKLYKRQYPRVINTQDTLVYLAKHKKSFARFGDGELNLIAGKSIGFQSSDVKLSNALRNVLKSHNHDCIIGVPDVFTSLKRFNTDAKFFWLYTVVTNWHKWRQLLTHKLYYDSLASRYYMDLQDKTISDSTFLLWQNLWQNRDIVIIEGEHTKMGVGNNMFNNTTSIKRIICPSKNAFDIYPRILTEAKKLPKDSLILIALGPTATVLAYDLSEDGFQAIDTGHLDLEYNWMKNRTRKKAPIPGRSINELHDEKFTEINDETYFNQILIKIED